MCETSEQTLRNILENAKAYINSTSDNISKVNSDEEKSEELDEFVKYNDTTNNQISTNHRCKRCKKDLKDANALKKHMYSSHK